MLCCVSLWDSIFLNIFIPLSSLCNPLAIEQSRRNCSKITVGPNNELSNNDLRLDGNAQIQKCICIILLYWSSSVLIAFCTPSVLRESTQLSTGICHGSKSRFKIDNNFAVNHWKIIDYININLFIIYYILTGMEIIHLTEFLTVSLLVDSV